MTKPVMVFLAAMVMASCQRPAGGSDTSGSGPGATAQTVLERVESKKVCMVNNRYMGQDQSAVVVENKTYYGCCPMCEKRLNDEPATRSATDPVSGHRVDKASAVIGKLRTGSSKKVLYFESDETFAAYRGEKLSDARR
ncbi:MAG: TRASH domain-containing protein [Polyangiaceae bacterium]|nr:TRASH domain-containing protein [Myxococcales bacterium]MCC6898468.1 TRASH domain-containing protein [Polyangiaceae bacterium]